MYEVISGDALELYLSDLKTIFRKYDYNKLKKMIFLSIDSFLQFIDKSSGRGQSGKSFMELIETMEAYIPLVISNESLDDYLLCAVSQDEGELQRLQRQFVQHSKLRFVKSVINADNDEDLEEIFELCRTIREYKEKAAL